MTASELVTKYYDEEISKKEFETEFSRYYDDNNFIEYMSRNIEFGSIETLESGLKAYKLDHEIEVCSRINAKNNDTEIENKYRIVTGIKALNIIDSYYEDDVIDYKELKELLWNNPSTFNIEVLSDDEKEFIDCRIYDPYNLYCSERTIYVNPTGYTHWLLETDEASEWEVLQ